VVVCVLFFFFQAEDGIRDRTVTGVQTCALPIWFRVERLSVLSTTLRRSTRNPRPAGPCAGAAASAALQSASRSRTRPSVRWAVKIGRASCRERGEGWGGAVGREEGDGARGWGAR